MKPRYLFAFVVVTLLGGTLFSRYATADGFGGGDRRGDSEVIFGDAVPKLPASLRDGAVAMTRLKGTTALGAGEARALRQIVRSLDAEGGAGDVSAAAPIGVTWNEAYRQKTVTLRAYYLPSEKALICSAGPHRTYAYQPVTREGMEAALRDGEQAPFANANVYSLPRTPAR